MMKFQKIEFHVRPHGITRAPMVEVVGDGKLIGAIYGRERGVRFISKYEVEAVPREGDISDIFLIFAGDTE